MAKKVRTFIAIDVGKSLRDRCIAMQKTLALSDVDVKWVEPDNIHITLLFLGQVGDRDLPDICQAVSEVCAAHAPFTLTLGGVGCFPNPRRPRIIWGGVREGTDELTALHTDLEEPLLDLGCYRREARKYTPHLTLGRVQGDGETEPLSEAIAEQEAWAPGDRQVKDVHVMSSQLTSKGPIYSVLSRAKLGG